MAMRGHTRLFFPLVLLLPMLALAGGCSRYTLNENLRLPYQGPNELAPPNLTLAEKARAYQALLARINRSPEGLLIARTTIKNEPELGPAQRPYPQRYLTQSDGTFLSGLNLAALGYHYACTRSPQTLALLKDFLHGFVMLASATGTPGLWVRDLAPANELTSWPEHWIPSPALPGFYMGTDVSRDQYYGVLFGLGVLGKTIAAKPHRLPSCLLDGTVSRVHPAGRIIRVLPQAPLIRHNNHLPYARISRRFTHKNRNMP